MGKFGHTIARDDVKPLVACDNCPHVKRTPREIPTYAVVQREQSKEGLGPTMVLRGRPGGRRRGQLKYPEHALAMQGLDVLPWSAEAGHEVLGGADCRSPAMVMLMSHKGQLGLAKRA